MTFLGRVRRIDWRRTAFLVTFLLAFLLVPVGSVQAAVPGCEGEPAPQPEAAGSGADGLLVPPRSQSSIVGSPDGLPPDASIYGQYGTAGQQWHTIRESCVDKLSSSAVATLSNTAWDLSKTINQSTITVYQAATSDGLLDSFNDVVVSVIAELREGIWRPLLPTVVILGAIWLGWYGLIRKRVTLTIESSVWMVLAATLGIWILVNPAQIMGYASTVVNAGGNLVNSSISRVSVPGASGTCPAGAPEIERAEWESENDFAVRRNSQMLWSGLVCRPWIAGVFGSGEVAESAAAFHGMSLLEAQGVSRIEQKQISDGEINPVELIQDKQENYQEIASSVEESYPGVYPLFEGSQQGSRLGVATLALFSAIFAGGLILAGSVALIVLKIGFLLLLLLSPVFLLIGIHPGYGRTVLIRWVEMLLGLLLKQIFVVLLIALLVMCYGLVMASGLGWGLQMILLALFTVALFIYRRPFANLFASVNANTFTSRMVSDAVNSRVLEASANVLPPVAYMKAQKWGLNRAPQLAAGAAAIPAGAAATAGGGGG
ncbi:type IV secretion system protein, partial [Thermobifida halotolerans]|uniref:type IV secretion system protein n=1 Tax=Thermobifida halotolerans TaxID=483545 RepID=UPI001F3BF01F